MQHELKVFVKKVWKEDSERIFREQLDSAGIYNVDGATTAQRKQLAQGLKASFPYVSLAKTNVLYAELYKILNLQVFDIGKDKLDIITGETYWDEFGNEVDSEDAFYDKSGKKFFINKEEYTQYRIETQRKVVNHFWSQVDRSLTKFEVIFNLFWLKAGEAELRGMKHKDVMKVTNKALLGIKKDLKNAFNEVKTQFGIKIEENKGPKVKFHFKNLPKLKKVHQDLAEMKKKYKGEDEIIQAIEEFWTKINTLYLEFKELFMISLNKEIELRKRNMSDQDLIDLTEDKIMEIWKVIERSYENLKKTLEKIQENALKND